MIQAGGGGPAAAGDADGYKLVVHRRRGARKPKATKEAERVPAGRLRVRKSGKPEAGNRYGVVREKGPGAFRDCAACGEPAWGGQFCGAGGERCGNAEV